MKTAFRYVQGRPRWLTFCTVLTRKRCTSPRGSPEHKRQRASSGMISLMTLRLRGKPRPTKTSLEHCTPHHHHHHRTTATSPRQDHHRTTPTRHYMPPHATTRHRRPPQATAGHYTAERGSMWNTEKAHPGTQERPFCRTSRFRTQDQAPLPGFQRTFQHETSVVVQA